MANQTNQTSNLETLQAYKNKVNQKEVSTDIRTNIIYFTTKCNLACTYCYEALDEVNGINTSIEDLYKIADEAIEREPDDVQTFFGLFGGEPTLAWDNVEKFMDYAYSKKQNVHFEMITNGIKFKNEDFIHRVYNNEHVKNGRLSISISFDGIKGNVQRVYSNGKQSVYDVIEALAKLTYLGKRFRIRYTIHKDNIDTILEDIEDIMNNFKPLRIITSEVNSLFDSEDYRKIFIAYNTLKDKWNNGEIQIPICELFCETCTGCSITRSKLQYSIQDKKIVKDHRSIGAFDDFDFIKKDKNEN
jgi:sulfatase maturation enzyme AslB (radical SAM superfamily)